MIEELKPYDSYQPVNSRWIPRAPIHWEVTKLRALTTPWSERNRPDLPLLSVARERGVFVRTADDDNHNVVPDDLSNYKVARAGALVINKMKAWQGSMGIAPTDGIVSPAYFVYDLRVSNRMFGQALLRSRPYVAHFAQASDGVRVGQWDLSINRMREIPVLLPPPEEQEAIVRFLDHANRRIDQFMRAKKKLIALLNEQKQAIIHRAVTGGTTSVGRPQIERDEFLGYIPRHWPMKRAKYLFRQVVAPIPDNAEQVTCFRDGQVTLRRNRRTTGYTEAIYELGYQGISPGQLVVHSMDAFAGAIGVSDSSGKCSPEYVILEPESQDVDPQYYALLLRHLALRGLFKALCPSVRERAPRVRFNDFGSFALPVPPFDEQHSIVSHANKASLALEGALKNAREQLDRVQEYRTRLISDVVTGLVDVRAAAASLPDIAPGDTSDDEEADIDNTEAS